MSGNSGKASSCRGALALDARPLFQQRQRGRVIQVLAAFLSRDFVDFLDGFQPRELDAGLARRVARRAAVQRRRFNVAEAVYRAVILAARPDDCPGDSSWVQMVVESIRLFRNVDWRTREVLDRAIEMSVARGDLRSQATLFATRAWEAQRLRCSRAHIYNLAHGKIRP